MGTDIVQDLGVNPEPALQKDLQGGAQMRRQLSIVTQGVHTLSYAEAC